MSLTWKIILPLAIVVIVGAAVGVYKNRSVTPATETSETGQNMVSEEKSYNPDAKPITDAEIDILLKDSGAESSAYADEEQDSATVTSDNQELNNFDSAYVSTDF